MAGALFHASALTKNGEQKSKRQTSAMMMSAVERPRIPVADHFFRVCRDSRNKHRLAIYGCLYPRTHEGRNRYSFCRVYKKALTRRLPSFPPFVLIIAEDSTCSFSRHE